uniref:Trans-1,2-dihydrobenzene-1,2-diol dehydrogenase n=1 Tax=Steinernema glaseri TaxID=37863 RepID=A0A1I7YMN0_9BILA
MITRWGILGCGHISGDFVESLKLLSDGHKVVAIAGRCRERVNEFAQKHNLCDVNLYYDYDSLIDEEKADVLYVGTRNHTHFELVMRALDAGKAVLCEKPMGLSQDQVKAMIEKAKAKSLLLQEGFWSRFFPVYKDIRRLLDSNAIGEVKIIQADMGFPIMASTERLSKKEYGGGMAFDVGCYLVQFFVLVFGADAPIEDIVVNGWTSGPDNLDDSASITIMLEGNRMAQLLYSGSASLGARAQICGTKGRIDIPELFFCPNEYNLTVLPTNTFMKSVSKKVTHPPTTNADPKAFHFGFTHGLVYEAEGVRRALVEGNIECPEMTHNESLKVIELLDRIRQKIYG